MITYQDLLAVGEDEKERMAFVPSGGLGKRLSLDGGHDHAAVDDEASYRAACSNSKGDVRNRTHGSSFRHGIWSALYRCLPIAFGYSV